MSKNLAAQYPHICYSHRVHLAQSKRGDLEPLGDHTAIRRGFYALILRQEGHNPEDALRMAYERYPER